MLSLSIREPPGLEQMAGHPRPRRQLAEKRRRGRGRPQREQQVAASRSRLDWRVEEGYFARVGEGYPYEQDDSTMTPYLWRMTLILGFGLAGLPAGAGEQKPKGLDFRAKLGEVHPGGGDHSDLDRQIAAIRERLAQKK
jgi:hypothetical protein